MKALRYPYFPREEYAARYARTQEMLKAHGLDALRRGMSHAKSVDGCDAIWELRNIKSPAEIARMRKAAQLLARGVKAGFEALRPAMTEKQVVDVMTAAMCGWRN